MSASDRLDVSSFPSLVIHSRGARWPHAMFGNSGVHAREDAS